MNNFWDSLQKPILALAPMAGITDSPTRIIAKRFGAELLVTEFVSAAGLYYNNQKTKLIAKYQKQEHPIIIQFFGNNPNHFQTATKFANESGFDGIDLNFGCPAKKIVNSGCGVSLMQDPVLVKELIQAAVESSVLPVSIKVRAGYKHIRTIDFLQGIDINSLGIRAITVHGRTYEQGFKGDIDFQMIYEINSLNRSITIANGGIASVADLDYMLTRTNCDGVMIGQASLGNPFLFRQLQDWKNHNYSSKWEISNVERIEYMQKHYSLAFDEYNDYASVVMRKHFGWYLKGLPNAKEFKLKLFKASSKRETMKILEEMYLYYQSLAA